MRALVTLLVAVIMVALGAISYATEDLLALTNADRTRHGLAPLTRTPDLQAYAQRRAEEMMRAAKLWHSSNLGTAVTNWRVLGENVGRGPSLPAIESAFMASPAHRVNILSPQFSQAGVGVVWDGVDEFYVAVIFRQPTTVAAPTAAPKARPAVARLAASPPRAAHPVPAPPMAPPATVAPPVPSPEPAGVEAAAVAGEAGPRLNWALAATTGESLAPPAPAPPASDPPNGTSPALLAAASTAPAAKDGSSAPLLAAVAFLAVVCAWRAILGEAQRRFVAGVRS